VAALFLYFLTYLIQLLWISFDRFLFLNLQLKAATKRLILSLEVNISLQIEDIDIILSFQKMAVSSE